MSNKPTGRPAKVATHCDVLTTDAGRIGAYGYAKGIIITDVPAAVAELYAGWMSADTDAVKAARSTGADMVSFRG